MPFDVQNPGMPGDTVLAVVLGALLATFGGFIAARLEAWLRRGERERDAGLLLGEVVFTFGMVLKMAIESRAIGDPYGPITLRMLRGAQREADAYERNRERLSDLRDAPLRIKVHTSMITLTMTLEGLLDYTRDIAAAPDTPAGRASAEGLRAQRDGSFDFIASTVTQLDPLLQRLGAIAHVSFAGHEAIARA
jgi:hypothetical protein